MRANNATKNRTYGFLYIVGAGMMALLAVGAWPKLKTKQALDLSIAQKNGPRSVNVQKVERAKNSSELVLPASVVPIESAAIYARVQGYVRELHVDIGDKVEADQTLAVLDVPEVEADLRRAEARWAEAARNRALAATTTDRFARLAEAGASSKQLADEAVARRNSAEAAVAANKAEVDRLRSQFAFRLVKAPFAGVVTKRNVDKGALVTSGSSAGIMSLFELSRLDQLRVFADVPQAYANSIQVNDAATLINGTLRVPARVVRTSSALDPVTRTLRVEALVDGDRGILSGSFVRIAFATKSANPPVLVSSSSLAPRGAQLFVYIVDGDKVKEVPVELGRELGAQAEIIGGLEGGESVVINPPESLMNGSTVRVVGGAT